MAPKAEVTVAQQLAFCCSTCGLQERQGGTSKSVSGHPCKFSRFEETRLFADLVRGQAVGKHMYSAVDGV
jgi:hypothetical protein